MAVEVVYVAALTSWDVAAFAAVETLVSGQQRR